MDIAEGRQNVARQFVKDQLSPAEQGETFQVPALMSEIQGELAFADTDIFMEFHDWSLLDHSSRLGEAEFAIRETARRMARNSGARRPSTACRA